MNNLLSRLDKYKYGLFVMVIFYVIFSSIHIQYGFVEKPDISYLLNRKPDDVIELKLEPIEMVEQRINATGEIQNATRNENSSGNSSDGGNGSPYESQYTNAKSLKDVEQSVYDLERNLFEEAGGAQQRAEIQKEIERRKKEQEDNSKNKTLNSKSTGTSGGTGDSAKGEVLVSYSLKGRSGSYTPAPGYMCPQGTTGKVVINIKVDASGKVVDARVGSSTSSNDCMINYALDFAKKSRFNYSSTAPTSQEGTITYTYVN